MSVIFNFVAIFVNFYWWNQGRPIFQVSFFNLFSTLALFASYLLGSYYLHQRDVRFVMLLSTVFAGLSFVALFFINRIIVLSVISGVAMVGPTLFTHLAVHRYEPVHGVGRRL